MKRKMASVETVLSVEPIVFKDKEGKEQTAENVEHIRVLGWNLVVQKGQFKLGDKCVYVEIDALMPETPEFEFLRKCCYIDKNGFKGFLIKTSRRLGVLSQGIAFPMDILPKGEYEVGQVVADTLGIMKYDPPLPACLGGLAKGTFPYFIPQTDEMRIHAVPDFLNRHRGARVYASVKMDGSSATYYLYEGVFGVCSKEIDLQYTPTNTFWNIARKYDIEDKLRKYSSVRGELGIQGELVGPGIRKNRHGLKDHDLYVYSVYSFRDHTYLDMDAAMNVCNDLGLKFVPIMSEFNLDHTIEQLEQMATSPDIVNPKSKLEGIVIRSITEDTDLQTGRFSFKVIAPKSLV